MLMDLEKRNLHRNNILNYVGNDEMWVFHPLIEYHVVSNTGKIKNLVTEKILKLQKNSNGYLGVNVNFVNKGRRFALIHRLICESFFSYTGVENYFYEVNHIDGNKTNNNLINLEWLTREENLKHARLHKHKYVKYGEDNGNCKFSLKDIEDMIEFRKLGFTFTQISKSYNTNRSYVSNLINGKTKRQLSKKENKNENSKNT